MVHPCTEHGICWLRDILPKKLPGARIFSYGYDAAVFNSYGTGDFDIYARTLLNHLKGRRRTEEVLYPLL